MKIEKLDIDRIKITLNIDDLKRNNIDFHSFMANSKESQNLFLYILDLAEEQVGFITDNYKVSIETMYLNNGHFILHITRFKGDTSFRHSRVVPKKKEPAHELNSSIYVFSSMNTFLEFYSKIKKSFDIKILDDCKYSLYFLHDKYYMVIDSNCLNTKYKNSFLYLLSEFSILINKTSALQNNLSEYSKCICKNKKFNKRRT